MKRVPQTHRWLCGAAISLMISGSADTALAQYTNYVVSTFDTIGALAGVSAGGNAPSIVNWSAEDADGNAASGSMSVTAEWTDRMGGWQEVQIALEQPQFPWFGLTLAPYYQVELDIKVDQANSFPDTQGNYARVQLVCQGWDGNGINSNVGWVPISSYTILNTIGWQHISIPLALFQRNNLNKLVLDFIGQTVATNTMVYLVDNIKLTVPTGPPPTLSLQEPAPAGLNLITGGQYSRQNIRTVGSNFGWVGAGGPVTYSVTINSYPNSALYPNLQTHILLVPNPPAGTASDPDWSATNVVRFDIGNNMDGTAYSNLRYKTNSPGSNGIYYDEGDLGGPGSATIMGTWSVRFNDSTSVTLTSPDTTTTNVTLPAEVVSYFNAANFRVYFGVMAGQVANIGQRVVFGAAQITGAGGGLSDDFSGASLNLTKWQIAAATPANIFQVSPTIAYNLSWLLPDNLFNLLATANLGNPNSFADPGLPAAVSLGVKSVTVPEGVPGADQGYFVLAKRIATKLQLLLPGETAAPGTMTGKTGAPTPQTAGVGYQVKVNAVDDDWHQAHRPDEVTIYSNAGDPPVAWNWQWAPQLVLGSRMYWFTNLTAGSWNVSVSDVTDTNILSNTSSPLTVNP